MSEQNDSGTGAFLAGFIIGGLVGAAAALVLAPQSGEQTRGQLAQQGDWLRDSAYRQRRAAEEQGNSIQETVEAAVNDAEETLEEAPRIVLNGGRSATTDSEAADPESGS
jgi:gas vesicle protein